MTPVRKKIWLVMFYGISALVGYSMPNPIIYITWMIIVKGTQKAVFSIATTLRCKGGCYSFPCTI